MEESQQSPGLLCEIMSPTSGSSKVNKMSFSWLSRVSQQAFQCFLPLPVLVCWAHARSNHFLLWVIFTQRETHAADKDCETINTQEQPKIEAQALMYFSSETSENKACRRTVFTSMKGRAAENRQLNTELRQHKGNKRKELNQYGKTPDTNYPPSRKGRLLPTDGNQLATWLPENTWAAVWSQDANEAEGKVEADLPTSWERRN